MCSHLQKIIPLLSRLNDLIFLSLFSHPDISPYLKAQIDFYTGKKQFSLKSIDRFRFLCLLLTLNEYFYAHT